MHGEGQVVLGQPRLELVDEVGGARLRLDDGELAVLDAGARHRVAAERRDVVDLQPDGVEAVGQVVDADRDDVEDHDLLLCGQGDATRAGGLGEVGQGCKARAGEASDDGGGADVQVTVALQVHADVVAPAVHRTARCRAVDQRPTEVLLLEHLAEALGTPVLDEELQSRLRAQPAVAVVAEDGDDTGPHIRHLVQRHPRAQPHGQVRVRRQAPADPQVEAGAVLGVDHADEGDVVDLVRDF